MTFIKALLFFSTLVASGSAPTISLGEPTSPLVAPMRVAVVRSAYDGCEPHCDEWISAEGQIDKHTLGLFRRTLKSIGARKLPIFISSTGGVGDAAIEIGRLIRGKGLDVAVARTEFAPGDEASVSRNEPSSREKRETAKPPPIRGRPRSRGAFCASACTLVLAAGTRRFVGPEALVGVHEGVVPEHVVTQKVRYFQIRTLRRGDRIVSREKIFIGERTISRFVARSKPSSDIYRRIRDYLVEMGVSREVVKLMKTAPPERVHWLTKAELASTRLSTDDRGGETLVAVPPQPVATPARSIVPVTPPIEAQAEQPSTAETPRPKEAESRPALPPVWLWPSSYFRPCGALCGQR